MVHALGPPNIVRRNRVIIPVRVTPVQGTR
jgi:hypothetical protein